MKDAAWSAGQADSAVAAASPPNGAAALSGEPAGLEAARTVPPAPRPTCDWPMPCTTKWAALSADNTVTLEARYVRCPKTATQQNQLLTYCRKHAVVVAQNRAALIADRRLPELENWRDELLPPGGHWTPVDTVETGRML